MKSFRLAVLLVAALSGTATVEADGVHVDLYFYWSSRCPHCTEARPFVDELVRQRDWLRLHSRPLDGDPDNRRRYVEQAAELGEQARSVPAFLFCRQLHVGYEDAVTTGAQLAAALDACHQRLLAGEEPGTAQASAQQPGSAQGGPGLPGVLRGDLSLPLVTVTIAALDAFNPCAFFVLLFLLSLLVHARSRARMLFIGGVFVFFSGLIYFIFMAAWLNLFLVLGQLAWITLLAGIVAIVLGSLNLRDYLRPGLAGGLSIPRRARPGLFRRMRGLLQVENTALLLLGTVSLAIIANGYELLCTSGLPMIYTRLLTLRDPGVAGYYLYLLLYNLVYILPLLVIVLLFTWAIGARKLQAEEGRLLKLLSGLMMLGLGAILLVNPAWLEDIRVTLGLVAGAVLLTLLANRRVRAIMDGKRARVPRDS